MKSLVLAGLLAVVGCATTEPRPISAAQVRQFRETVAKAEKNNACDLVPEATAQLSAAKSDFYYAEHSPANPDRAREMAQRAQNEADQALGLMSPNQHDLALGGDPEKH